MDKFIFTAKGLEYAAKTATGSVLVFTRGKFGSGTTSGDVANLINLINPLGELQISKKTVTENQVTIETQFTNTLSDSATLPPFHLTEIGLFAKLQTSGGADDSQYPETLVCYAHATGSDEGDYIPSTPTEFIINWPFSVSNADNVQITVGLGAFALQRDLDSETAARAEAEKTLQKNIDNEKSAREAADKDFSQRLDSEKTAREQGDSDAKTYAETAIRTAIDALVNGAPDAMDTLKELADAMKENKDALDALREIASSKVNSSDFTAHKEKIASITELGHVKLYNRSGVNASGILIYDDGSIVVNVDNRHGLYRSGAGQVMIAAASEEDIAAKTDEYKPLVPLHIDYAVMNAAPTYTEAPYAEAIVSGEKLSTAFGKIRKAMLALFSLQSTVSSLSSKVDTIARTALDSIYAMLLLNKDRLEVCDDPDDFTISYSEHESGIYSLGVQMVEDNYYDLPIRADSPVFIVSIAAKSGDDSEIYNSQGLLYADGTCYERIRYLWFMTSGQQMNPQFGEWSKDCSHISRELFRLDS